MALQTGVGAWVEADRPRPWASLPPGIHALTRSKMATARAQLVNAYLTRRRLCVARRVRRAFLLGKSPTTARSGLRTGTRNRMKDEVFRGSEMDAQYLHLLLRQLEFRVWRLGKKLGTRSDPLETPERSLELGPTPWMD